MRLRPKVSPDQGFQRLGTYVHKSRNFLGRRFVPSKKVDLKTISRAPRKIGQPPLLDALFKLHIRGDDGLALVLHVENDGLLHFIQTAGDAHMNIVKICNGSDGRPWPTILPVLVGNCGLVGDPIEANGLIPLEKAHLIGLALNGLDLAHSIIKPWNIV